MSNEGQIRAADLLDEKALILFQELEEIIKQNVVAITTLKTANDELAKRNGRRTSLQIANQQKIIDNLKIINVLQKEAIDAELKLISTQTSAEAKREAVRKKETASKKASASATTAAAAHEEAELRKILALRTRFAKQAEAVETARANKFIADAKREAVAAEQSIVKRRKAWKDFAIGIASTFYAIQAAFAIFKRMWDSVVNNLQVLDSFQLLMKRVTGTTSEAAESMTYLIRESKAYGLQLKQMTQRYSKFYAAAKQAGLTVKETRDIFSSVAKVSGIVGLKADELSGVFLALEQMLSKGKVTTEELRRQLGERLPGAFGIMANAVAKLHPELNVTVQTLDDLLKKGLIISSEVMPEFSKQLEIAFGALNVTKVETLIAAQQNLNTAALEFLYTLENGNSEMSNFFRGIYDGLTSNITALTEWMRLQGLNEEQQERLRLAKNTANSYWLEKIIGFDTANVDKAAKAYADLKKEMLDTLDYQDLNVKYTADWLELTYAAKLDAGELKTAEEQRLWIAAETFKIKELTNDELKTEIDRLTEINMLESKAEETLPQSIKYYGEKIKLVKEQLNTQFNMESVMADKLNPAHEQEILFLQTQLGYYEDKKKALEDILGLTKDKLKKDKMEFQAEDPIAFDYVEGGSINAFSNDLFAEDARTKLSALEDINNRIEEYKKLLAESNDLSFIQIGQFENQIRLLEQQKQGLLDIKDIIIETVDIFDEVGDDYFKSFTNAFEVAWAKITGGTALGNEDKVAGGLAGAFNILPSKEKMREEYEAKTKFAWDPEKTDLENQANFEKGFNAYYTSTVESYNQMLQMGADIAGQLMDFGAAVFERRVEELQAEIQMTEEFYDKKLELAERDSEQWHDLQKRKEQEVSKLRARELKARQAQARYEKAQAIVDITINTAKAVVAMLDVKPVPLNFIMAGLVGALGAVQLGTVVAQPIPLYAKGREGGPAELAITGDGGKHEYIVGNKGIQKTPNKPTLTFLNKGDSVLKDDKALQHMLYQTLLNKHGIVFQDDKTNIEDAIAKGFSKARVNNYMRLPELKINFEDAAYVIKNSQF